MKPVVQVWVTTKGLQTIVRGNWPSTWWRQAPSDLNAICISVSSDWFVRLLEYEASMDADDLPF